MWPGARHRHTKPERAASVYIRYRSFWSNSSQQDGSNKNRTRWLPSGHMANCIFLKLTYGEVVIFFGPVDAVITVAASPSATPPCKLKLARRRQCRLPKTS